MGVKSQRRLVIDDLNSGSNVSGFKAHYSPLDYFEQKMYFKRLWDRIFENRIILEDSGLKVVVGTLWGFVSNHVRKTHHLNFQAQRDIHAECMKFSGGEGWRTWPGGCHMFAETVAEMKSFFFQKKKWGLWCSLLQYYLGKILKSKISGLLTSKPLSFH